MKQQPRIPTVTRFISDNLSQDSRRWDDEFEDHRKREGLRHMLETRGRISSLSLFHPPAKH